MAKYNRGRNKHAPSRALFRRRELCWEAFTSGSDVVPPQTLLDRATTLAGELGSLASGVTHDRHHVSRRRLEQRAAEARRGASKAEARDALKHVAVRAAIHESMQQMPEPPKNPIPQKVFVMQQGEVA